MKPMAGEAFAPHMLFVSLPVPISIAADPKLSWFAKILYGRLRLHAGKKDSCFVRLETLGQELGTSIDTVGRGLKELIDAGLVARRRRGPGKENVYFFTWHPSLEQSLNARSSDSAKVRNQEASDSADLRCKTPQICGDPAAKVRNHYKEEKVLEKVPLKGNRHAQRERSPSFAEFWSRYPHKVEEQLALQIWLSLIALEDEPKVFACLEAYELSDEWRRGIYQQPQNWIRDRARNGWKDRPASAKSKGVGGANLDALKREFGETA